MLIITQTALELGFLYALVAMALFLSYRILDIADLTTDGCFVLGAAVSVTVTAAGHPVLAIFAAMLAGACAGFVTAFLQTKLGVPSILAGIVTNTGLYTINLMAMGWKSNQSLLGGKTVFTMLRETGIGGEWYELLLAAFVTLLAGLLLVLFLGTRMGLSIRATGDNPDMVRASSLNPSFTITVAFLFSLLYIVTNLNYRSSASIRRLWTSTPARASSSSASPASSSARRCSGAEASKRASSPRFSARSFTVSSTPSYSTRRSCPSSA